MDFADLLAGQSLFSGLDPQDRAELVPTLEQVSLPGGTTLFAEGDPADALYILLTGAIGISINDAQGRPRRIARIAPPETIGEMALFSNEPLRSGTAVALRDSTLLKLGREAFDRLVEHRPAPMMYMARLLSDRLRRTTAATQLPHAPTTFAVLPLTADVPAAGFGRSLAREMEKFCGRVGCLGAFPDNADDAWFHRYECGHDRVVYIADPPGSDWANLCVRRADHLLLLAKAGAEPLVVSPAAGDPELPSLASEWRRCDLVLMQRSGAIRPEAAHPAFDRLAVNLKLQLRDGDDSDLARVARIVCGRAFGLVLGGGGARGFAHIGVLQALEEYGRPVDLIAGASMGAVVGAAAAMGWTIEEIRRRIYAAFVKSSPLDDYTTPFVALLRGHKVDKRLSDHFGERLIEDLWLPFFCVSSNLTIGVSKVHSRGCLWPALRASISIPGLLPPVVEGEGVLVDGAVMNNVPADVLAGLQRGPILAVDVAGDHALQPRAGEGRITGFARRLLGVPPEMPTIVSLLFRTAMVPSEAQTTLARAHATTILRPPLAHVDLRAWGQFEAVMQIGHAHARQAFEEGALTAFDD